MQGTRRDSLKTRATVIALTLAVHALFLLLLWIEGSVPRREIQPLPQKINAWILLPPAPPPPEPEAAEEPPPAPRSSTPARAPTRAITLPPAIESPAPARPSATPAPDIDWRAEAARLTAGYGEDEVEPTGIGKPLPRLREPCEPRQSSFEWKYRKPPEEEELPPLPDGATPPAGSVRMGGARVGVAGVGITSGAITLGWEPPPPNKHFFDDMQAGKTPKSSVPSPHVCD
jgi:hypothetical protein